jgi:DNA-binding transcriptional LysR family regulator
MGLAILPEPTIRSEVDDRTLVAVRLDGDCTRPLAVIYRNGKVLTPAMKMLIGFLGKSVCLPGDLADELQEPV